MKNIAIVVGALILLFVIYAVLHEQTPQEKEMASAGYSIDYCWDEQKKKSIEPELARFVASTCEKMESDFKSKYGRNP